MENTHVAIIMTPDHNKEDIVKELQEEGYKHSFCFVNLMPPMDAILALNEANEVWIWGDCTDLAYYKYSVSKGKDIWKMGK